LPTTLYDVAHARTGDKGDTSTLTVVPYDDADYDTLAHVVTAERVRAHLEPYVRGEVTRFELPNISCLQFVCHHSLAGGVTTSLALDTHGKGLSSRLLALDLPGWGPQAVGKHGSPGSF
jgi:hypothetical protein